TDDAAGERLASETHHPPPLAERSLRRHTPEVGAVCGKAARTVLCGGRAMKRASLPLHRRELIALLASTAATWPVRARAQQQEHVRRIGVLMPFAVASAQYQARISVFLHGLRELGWVDGRNIQIEYRANTGTHAEIRKPATEFVGVGPDGILATGVSTVGPLQQVTS